MRGDLRPCAWKKRSCPSERPVLGEGSMGQALLRSLPTGLPPSLPHCAFWVQLLHTCTVFLKYEAIVIYEGDVVLIRGPPIMSISQKVRVPLVDYSFFK
ncbi:hypothetical protein CDAR_75871 [Caerostris darwini]|uniref:Uncharacterized protein n=1 Tax=Caerostris darwini TaxID=1538125 RepID=A0AAV4W059_9ARAC|nr:hypothetical protein CDAR_75871 [Caerostris darwini]